jgi:hypothetical protein
VHCFIGYGHGTSFSCALTAGVAALWRAFFAEELASGVYDGVPFAWLFRQHLRDTARRPDGWDTARFGAGIVDAAALLSTPLPTPEEVAGPASRTASFNPFLAISDMFEGAEDAWNGLATFSSQLTSRVGRFGIDAVNATLVTLSELAATRGTFLQTAMAIGLRTAEQWATANAEMIEATWVEVQRYADETGDEIARRAADVANELADAYEQAAEAADQAAHAAAQAAEDAADDIVDTVEELAEAAGEGSDEVIEYFAGLFG